MNRVLFIGRLTKNPELKRLNEGNVVLNFTLARDRRFSRAKETDFIKFIAWNKTAETMEQYLGKGSLIAVKGRLQQDHYQTADGQNRVVLKVVCENVQFLETKLKDEAGIAQVPQQEPKWPKAYNKKNKKKNEKEWKMETKKQINIYPKTDLENHVTHKVFNVNLKDFIKKSNDFEILDNLKSEEKNFLVFYYLYNIAKDYLKTWKIEMNHSNHTNYLACFEFENKYIYVEDVKK